ncbi:MAG: DNA primase [Lachnospiraceae bacterium]|nr:DNA primase [Lachnospiraceae bacterium]
MALPSEFMQELRLRSDISQVVSGYVNLHRRGKISVGLCPFHGEKTPSFTVYPATESFYCFGCGVGGDVVSFIMRIENLDYIDAVKLLAQRAGLEMPQESSYDDSMQRLRLRVLEANREAARFFHSQLHTPQGKAGLEYLHGRQLSDGTIRSFGLGFAPDSWRSLTNHLLDKGFNSSELVQANLAMQSKKGDIYDRFRNRVMFPIIDTRGNVIAFGGRIMTDEKPKYLNTSDTVAFKKSNNLFALNRAKNSKSDKLILCEGYMDVIALHQAGFDFAVATLGTSLTSEQAVVIKRYTNTVVICYDSDEAGQKATARAIEILRRAGLDIHVLTIPDGKDPDEFIKKHGDSGAYRFRMLLENSGNDLEYKLTKLKEKYDMNTADGRAKYVNAAAVLLAGVRNSIQRDVYIGELAHEYNVTTESVERTVNYELRKRAKASKKDEFANAQKQLTNEGLAPIAGQRITGALRVVRAEEALIAYLVNNPDMAGKVTQSLPPQKFVTEFNRRVYSEVTSRILNGESAMLMDISPEFSAEEISRIAKILSNYNVDIATPKACMEYVDIILEESNKMTPKEITATMSNEEINRYFKWLGQAKKSKRKPN